MPNASFVDNFTSAKEPSNPASGKPVSWPPADAAEVLSRLSMNTGIKVRPNCLNDTTKKTVQKPLDQSTYNAMYHPIPICVAVLTIFASLYLAIDKAIYTIRSKSGGRKKNNKS